MRIVIFTENYWSGGLDVFIITLINNWPDVNDEFILVCNHDHPGLEIIEKRLQRQCKIIRHKLITDYQILKIWNSSFIKKWILRLVYLYGRYLVYLVQTILFINLIEKLKPNRIIVSTGGYPGGNTCRVVALSGLFKRSWGKLLFIYHNDPCPAHWSQIIPEYIFDMLLEKAVSALVTVSNSTLGGLRHRFALRHSSKRKVIYNGIETHPLSEKRYHSIYNELGIPEDRQIVLMLATYERRKGHEFLFQALQHVIKKCSKIFLVVAGFGYPHEREIVNNLVSQYSLTAYVRLLGFRNDISNLLKQAQLLVVPSQAFESFGLVCVEAMAHRVPVVATRVGGIPEVVKDGFGGFTVPLDPVLFAERMIQLLSNDDLRNEVAEKGYRVFLEKFTADRMCKEYYRLLNS